MAVTLADAFIQLRPDTRRLGPELRADTERAGATAGTTAGNTFGRTMVSAIKRAAIGVAVAGVFAGLTAGRFLLSTIDDASALNETVSKAQQIFPKTQAAIQAFAATSATALGLSRQQALEGAASFGNFFNQIGLGEDVAARMSTKLIQLSADLGSFNNADPAEVMQAFLSATRGEFDALQRFIPTVNAAAIQEEALRLTRKKSTKDLTEADKALALYNIALRDVGKAQGDFARTSEGAANQERILRAQWANQRAEIGTALLPVYTKFLTMLTSRLMPALQELWARHGPQVVAWLSDAAEKIGPLADRLAAFDWKGFGADASSAFAKLGPAVRDFAREAGPAFWNSLSVGRVVLEFLAENADLLGKALPFLAAGFVLVKTAQLASNVVAAASVPLRIFEIASNRALVRSNQQLAAAVAAQTTVTRAAAAATMAGTAAENAGTLARTRAVASMVASKAAKLAEAAVTKVVTAAQWLWNIALMANPLGLIILAIIAGIAWMTLMALAIRKLYMENETFRRGVQVAWAAIRNAARAVAEWFMRDLLPILHNVWDAVIVGVNIWKRWIGLLVTVTVAVFTYVVNFIRTYIEIAVNTVRTVSRVYQFLRDAFERGRAAVVDRVIAIVAFVRELPGRIIGAIGNANNILFDIGRNLIEGLINGIRGMVGRLVGAVRDAISAIPGTAKKILGIASPSRVFFGFGVDTVRGFILGLQAEGRGLSFPGVAGGPLRFAPAGGGGGLRLHPQDLADLARALLNRPIVITLDGRQIDYTLGDRTSRFVRTP